jgi:hypothetical protein
MFFYKWGYARIVALSPTDLSWEWVESESGTVFDRMSISQITDFDENPYWVLSDSVLETGTIDDNEGSELSERQQGVNIEDILRHVKSFFTSVPGLIIIVMIFCIVFLFVTRTCLSPSGWSPGSEVYTKLPPTNCLSATILGEEAEEKDGRLYREIL